MKTGTRSWYVIGALGLALFAVLLTVFYVNNYKRHVQRGEAHTTVIIATHDIKADTLGSQILSGHMTSSQTIARRSLVPGAISNPDQVRGLMVVQPIYAGEQITLRRFRTPTERGIRAQLQGSQRAFQLPGDANQLLAGTLHAGDHVDVVASWDYPEGGQTHVSRIVLRNLLVLTAASAPERSSGLSSPTTPNLSAQLALTDGQSQKLEWLIANAEWRLELRPPTGAADSEGTLETAATLLGAGVRRGALDSLLATP
jgi:Flp pilus assembly protein CpaB